MFISAGSSSTNWNHSFSYIISSESSSFKKKKKGTWNFRPEFLLKKEATSWWDGLEIFTDHECENKNIREEMKEIKISEEKKLIKN